MAIQDYKDYKKLFVVDKDEGNFKGTLCHYANVFREPFDYNLSSITNI